MAVRHRLLMGLALAACSAAPAAPTGVALPPAPATTALPLATSRRPSTELPAAPMGTKPGTCAEGACEYPRQVCCTYHTGANVEEGTEEAVRHACVDEVELESPVHADKLEATYGACGDPVATYRLEIRHCDSSSDCPSDHVCCLDAPDYNESIAYCVPARPDGALACAQNERCAVEGAACATSQAECVAGMCMAKNRQPMRSAAFRCSSPSDCPPGALCCAGGDGSRCSASCYHGEGELYACTSDGDCPRTLLGHPVTMRCSGTKGPLRVCGD